ncbi:MAG: right-handed parallel beta-helix repeat-containing protein, partial [Bacteroidales bacterium]|nr:right-handed parallel beta-helix repeat-containing protein [Bacteroidales bacterium]
MKKYIILALGIFLMTPSMYSQTAVQKWTEDFDGNVSFTANPPSAWERDTNYFTSSPHAYLGTVPNIVGSISVLETPTYDFRVYNHILLRFKHICKVSPQDIIRIEYKISNEAWKPVPPSTYQGNSMTFLSRGFSAASYMEWEAGDSLAIPLASWWKEETFDLSFETGGDQAAQFRFIIQHGSIPGTQISYGWLLDDFEIIAATFEMRPPIVEFMSPVISDSVNSTGPYNIRARVKTSTKAPIEHPVLKYTATKNGTTIASDSILMTPTVAGDSLWNATIPQFQIGTTITYSITGKDTNNNQTMESLTYLIVGASGVPDTVIVGTGTIITYDLPIQMNYEYGWSRQLYMASEISTTSSGGWISHLAWDYAASSSQNRYTQKCYFRAVDDTVVTTDPFDPLGDGATQVWSGSIQLTQGWSEIKLDVPFFLPHGKNLLIYWEHKQGYYNTYYYFRAHTTPVYRSVGSMDRTAFPSTYYGIRDIERVNARFVISSVPASNTPSAVLQSIDVPNPLIIAPNTQVPVVARIQNKAFTDLDSVVITYSINGSTPTDKVWRGKLALDMSIQDTLDYYTPKMNGLDTFVVWISMPNGVTDGITYDDTVTKIVYACTDITIEFVEPPQDTVYYVGPFYIDVRMSSHTGNLPNTLWLHLNSTIGGATVVDSVAMSYDVSSNLWKSIIPLFNFGTNMVYSVNLTDVMGNPVSIIDSFFIKRALITDIAGVYTFGEADTLANIASTLAGVVYSTDQPTTWTRSLYQSYEISADRRPLNIAKIAWYNPGTSQGQTRTAFTIHLKTTLDKGHGITYRNPAGEGATLVYSGNITTKRGWNEVNLIAPFVVPQGSNLMIYFEDKTGSVPPPTTKVLWAASYCEAMNAFESMPGGIYGSDIAPILRFSFAGTSVPDSNSVALDKILPEPQDVIPGITNPIQAVIRNRGAKNLTSCSISWTLNGTAGTTYSYTGNLAEDFTDTVTLGYYTPVFGDRDIVKAWVSMPNGEIDLTNEDDTLTVEKLVCGNGMTGTYIVGLSTGANYASLNDAFSALQTCGIDQKVTLAIESGVYNQTMYLDMEALSNMGLTDTLVITSFTGNAADVTLKTTAAGMRFYNNHNIIVQAITIDATTGTYAIDFTAGLCNNIVIRDCRLFADTTSSSGSVIYKDLFGTQRIEDIYIINNLIMGGTNGIYLRSGYDQVYNDVYNGRIVVDSNIVINNFGTAISLGGDVILCNQNTISSPITGITNWYGIDATTGGDGRIMNNHIIQHGVATSPTGIAISHMTTATSTDTAIVANNEIILSASSAAQGIRFARAKILHNTIYISGTGASQGISVGNIGEMKNNIIVTLGNGAFPFNGNVANIFTNLSVDYNSTYSLSDMICGGAALLPLQVWKETIDIHSVRILPDFIDPTTSLKLASYTDLLAPVVYPINEDIDGVARNGITLMGCYGLSNATANAMLIEVEGLQEGFAVGQTDSVKVVLYNAGITPLTAVNLGWSINGVTQNGNIPLSVSLAQGESSALGFGTITYPAQKVTVKVWINSLNGGTAIDDYLPDDTISSSVYLCQSPFKGLLTIGATGDFPTLTEAYEALQLCGMNGNVTLAFQTGTYSGDIDLTNSDTLVGNYSLTFASLSGDANDVTLSSGGVGFRLNNTKNIIIKDITIDVRQGTFGIHFTGAAYNITVDNCIINANPTIIVTTVTTAGIYKPNNTGSLDGLTVKNCSIDGGFHGIYLYGTSTNYCQNVVIDNNTLTNQFRTAIYLYYVYTKSISYNRMSPRSLYTDTQWQGVNGAYLRNGGNIIGNRVSANSSTITSSFSGLYFSYIDTALIANNEIYINGNASTTDGIYIGYPGSVHVINNTVYTVKSGTAGTNRAHYNAIRSGYSSLIRNNIFAASGGAAGTTYAFYFYGSAADFTNYSAGYEADYNDYYSTGTNIGYVAGANRTDLTAWKTAIAPLDEHSVNKHPSFADSANSLALASYPDSLLCPRWQTVITDIRNIERPQSTAMGAYSQFTNGQDILLKEFAGWNNSVVDKQTKPVNITLLNNGVVPIANAEFGWSLNGTPQLPPFTWTATPSLDSLEERTINIGSFPVSNTIPDYNVVVWVNKVNGQSDTVKWNDTIRTSASLQTLAEFVAPLIPDTIVSLSFTANVFINSLSGATITTPKMTIVSTIHETTVVYDTIAMIFDVDNEIWQAIV